MTSLLTVTARTGWEKKAIESVMSQTMLPDEWIIVTEDYKYFTTCDFPDELNVEVIKAPPKIRPSNLNASLNLGIDSCHGDLIVFYQDFIDLQPDSIEKLVDLCVGDVMVTTVTRNVPGARDDMRYLKLDCVRPCIPEEWEANVAIAPKKVFYELGGFDEEYDNGWSWDNVSVAERAAILGYKFFLDETNRPQLLPHDRIEKKLNLESNSELHARKMREIREGRRPLKCPYL